MGQGLARSFGERVCGSGERQRATESSRQLSVGDNQIDDALLAKLLEQEKTFQDRHEHPGQLPLRSEQLSLRSEQLSIRSEQMSGQLDGPLPNSVVTQEQVFPLSVGDEAGIEPGGQIGFLQTSEQTHGIVTMDGLLQVVSSGRDPLSVNGRGRRGKGQTANEIAMLKKTRHYYLVGTKLSAESLSDEQIVGSDDWDEEASGLIVRTSTGRQIFCRARTMVEYVMWQRALEIGLSITIRSSRHSPTVFLVCMTSPYLTLL